MWWQIALVLAPLVLFAAAFLWKGRIGHVAAPPDRALAGIAYALRMSMHRVEERSGSLTVRLGSSTAVKVIARPSGDGADLFYQPYATPAGWSILMILFFLWTFAIISVPIVLYIFVRSWEFVRFQIAPFTAPGAMPPVPPIPTEVQALLIASLSEGHRLASEAYEAEQSTYHDFMIMAVVCGIAAWGLIFIWAFTSSADPDFGRRIGDANILSLTAGTVVAIIVGLAIRAGLRPRLLLLKGWADRLWGALATEVGWATRGESAPSTFELLSEASRELPRWFRSFRRGGLSREPGTWVVIFAVGIWAAFLFFGAASFALSAPFLAAGLALGGLLLALACYYLYQGWRTRLDSEEERLRSDWDHRLGTARESMERFFKDL